MKYSASQIAKVTGLSISGIRYYERTGVISPKRESNGKYRDYSIQELQLLRNCKQYRDYGFSMRESVELLNKSSLDGVLSKLDQQRKKIEKTIHHQQLLLEVLREKVRGFNCLISNEPYCEFSNCESLFYFPTGTPGGTNENNIPNDEMLQWLELEPLTSSILIISSEDFLLKTGNIETKKGLAINERFVIGLGLQTEPWGVFIPGFYCIQTFIRVNEDMSIDSTEFENARNFIKTNFLELSGQVFSRIFHLTNLHGKIERIDQLCVSVIRKK